MIAFQRGTTVLLLAVVLAGCDRQSKPPAAEPAPPKTIEAQQPKPRPTPVIVPPQKILSVEHVDVESVEGVPGTLAIAVLGSVNSGAWSRPELRLRTPQPADGVLTFDFFAQPPDPSEPQMPALKNIKLKITVDKPEGYREVRIVARTNSITAK